MAYPRSNNTNKFSPQEPVEALGVPNACSNNTNKFSPQELASTTASLVSCSNNTNKFSPQERRDNGVTVRCVQIIQINSALKN